MYILIHKDLQRIQMIQMGILPKEEYFQILVGSSYTY